MSAEIRPSGGLKGSLSIGADLPAGPGIPGILAEG